MKYKLTVLLTLITGLVLSTTVYAQDAETIISEDVMFTNNDITLAGTLTLPDTTGLHPAIVVISGSGEQNRDGVTAGFIDGYEPLRFLAEGLTPAGFAVLRYDERGVGESTGTHSTASTADFADDVQAALAYLMTRDDIDPTQIGLIGHSEGANIAAMVAANNPDIAFAISLAGQAVSGYELLEAQAAAIAEASGASPQAIEAAVAQGRAEWDLVLAEDWDGLADMTRDIFAVMPESQRPSPEMQEELIAQQDAFAKNWFSFFLTYNPAEDWSQVDAPVLIVFAELDAQVPVAQNRPAIEAALEDGITSDYEIIMLDDTNHLFQADAESGAPLEYMTLEPAFTPELIPTIRDWLLEHVTTS